MHRLEKITNKERDAVFDALTKYQVGAAFQEELNLKPLPGFDEEQTRRTLLASLVSSLAYQSSFYPDTSLANSDLPFAPLLMIEEVTPHYIICEGPNHTLYIGFAAIDLMETIITDSMEWSTPQRWRNKQAMAHPTLYTRAMAMESALKTKRLRESLSDEYRFLVLCGHSTGGAIAALTALRLMEDDEMAFNTSNMTCITFGSPLICNSALAHSVSCTPTKNGVFHHFVNRTDVVPRLLANKTWPSYPDAALVGENLRQFLLRLANDGFNASAETKRETAELMLLLADKGGEFYRVLNNMATNVVKKHHIHTYPYQCFGTYHFINRGVPYRAVSDPIDAFFMVKSDGGIAQLTIKDHAMDQYIDAIYRYRRKHAYLPAHL